jgi:hypothetical protein
VQRACSWQPRLLLGGGRSKQRHFLDSKSKILFRFSFGRSLPCNPRFTHTTPTLPSLNLKVQTQHKGGSKAAVQPRSFAASWVPSLVASPSSGSPKLVPISRSILACRWIPDALTWGCPCWIRTPLVLASFRPPTPSAPASKGG